jgi:uncharacterized protein (TIGR02996 family)
VALRDVDITAVEAAWAASDLAALAVAGERVGLVIDEEVGRALCHRSFRQVSGRELFATILRAVVEPAGIAVHIGALGIGVEVVCLAVRTDARVVVGIRSVRGGPGDAWPSLRPWFKQLSRNHDRCQRWAKIAAPDRLAIPLAPLPSSDRETEAALVAQLAERPDDPTVRMVLADLLLQTDDVRGELMRLAGSSVPEDLQRTAELVRRHGPRLAGEIAELASAYTLAGGFVDTVAMSAATFRTHGDRLFRAQPIRRLILQPFHSKALATFVRAPHTALVRELELATTDLRATPTMAALADADFARLAQLDLEGVVLAGADGEHALAHLRAPRLRSLQIRRGRFELAAFSGLASNRALTSSLETLVLSPTDGGSATSLTPFSTISLPNLRRLVLDNCRFGLEAHVAALIGRAPRLEHAQLDVSGSHVCAALAGCRELRAISIDRRIDADTFDAILRLPKLEAMTLRYDLEPASLYADRLLALPASHPLRGVEFPGRFYDALRRRFPGATIVPR